jgi:hypothetical protein
MLNVIAVATRVGAVRAYYILEIILKKHGVLGSPDGVIKDRRCARIE